MDFPSLRLFELLPLVNILLTNSRGQCGSLNTGSPVTWLQIDDNGSFLPGLIRDG